MGTKSKPKTRFGVRKGGHDRELFSVLERESGDLLILLRHAQLYEHGDKRISTSGQRYSVHCSPSSPGFTIKHTLSLEEGRQVDNAQFRLSGKDGLTALLFGRTVPDVGYHRYTMRPRQNDRIIRPYAEDIGFGTMFLFLIVFESGTGIPSIKTNLRPTFIPFSRFQLLVLTGFFMVPAVQSADLMHFGTSLPRYNPDAAPVHLVEPEPSPTVQEWVDTAYDSIGLLAEATAIRHQRVTCENGYALNAKQTEGLLGLLKVYKAAPPRLGKGGVR